MKDNLPFSDVEPPLGIDSTAGAVCWGEILRVLRVEQIGEETFVVFEAKDGGKCWINPRNIVSVQHVPGRRTVKPAIDRS